MEEVARHAVVARERVAPGGRKSRLAGASRPRRGRLAQRGGARVAPATCARWVRVDAERVVSPGVESPPRVVPAWVDSLVCAAESRRFMRESLRFVRESRTICAQLASFV